MAITPACFDDEKAKAVDMRIARIRRTPLLIRYKEPYHWARAAGQEYETVLVELETDGGIVGLGECVASPTAKVVDRALEAVSPVFLGQSPFDVARLYAEAYRRHFASIGTGSTPRYANQILAGLELALWDLIGKATRQPVHRLLGGAVRESIAYFAFLQGDTAGELAEDARQAVASGHSVIYVKVGRGEETDLENVAAVRDAIGDRRLRLDANEAWDTLTAIRMIRILSRYEPEFIEQPTPSGSIAALAHVKASVDVPIAADQSVFTPEDVYEVCRRRAADLIVLGLHETGGVLRFRKAAAVAEAAGMNVCLHGLFETGITTCASNQVGATVGNLDDGNQIMCQLLAEDVIATPDLTLRRGKLAVIGGAGWGFELDRDAVARAAERYRSENA